MYKYWLYIQTNKPSYIIKHISGILFVKFGQGPLLFYFSHLHILHAALPHTIRQLFLRELIFFNDSSVSGALHMADSQRTLNCFPPATSMQNSQELFQDLAIKMMSNICSHCCFQRQHHNSTDLQFFFSFLPPLSPLCLMCISLSVDRQPLEQQTKRDLPPAKPAGKTPLH